MTLIVEDSSLCRELFQSSYCGIAYSAIAILVKFPASASLELPLQHAAHAAAGFTGWYAAVS